MPTSNKYCTKLHHHCYCAESCQREGRNRLSINFNLPPVPDSCRWSTTPLFRLLVGIVSPFQRDSEGEYILHRGVRDGHHHGGHVLLVGGHVGDHPGHVHPAQNLAKHHVRPIQPLGGLHGDEELAAVGIGACQTTKSRRC